MGTTITFALYDVATLPLSSVTPTFVQYRDKSGNARTQPTINNLGGGQYDFTPSDADEIVGTAYVIDGTASAVPRYKYGTVDTESNPFALFCVFDAAGALSSGAPTVGLYEDLTGIARGQPAVVQVGSIAYMYTITPSILDVQVGVVFRLDAAATRLPAYLSGSFGISASATCPGLTTLLSIRTQCKQQSDNVGQSFISDAEWDGYIQSSYQELYGLIVQHFGNDYFTQSPAAGYQIVTDGVNQEFTLPCDLFKLLGVDLQISSPNYWVALKPFAFADRNRTSISNNPTPMAGQTIRLFYVPKLTLPTVDGDLIDGVNGWENYIVVDACMKALAKEESDYSAFAVRKAAMIERLNSEIENRDAGSPATIVDVMGRRARAMQYRLNGNRLWLIGNGMPGWGVGGDWGSDMEQFW